ncbi:MAG: sulfatase-like hydrolase/transferase [Candidatus Sumerlaeia bacterium]
MSPQEKRPNILFFFSDQQRWDTCGCYGQKLDTTPTLDRLAKEGVLFQNAFTCQPVCGPARACLQTGLYATQVGCNINSQALPIFADTIAKRLDQAGYETGYVGKWHLATNYGLKWDQAPPGVQPVNFANQPIPPERRGGYRDFWVASDILEFSSHGYGGCMWDGDGNKREWDEETYRADAQTDYALEFLNSRDGKKPWFLFCSYIEPHHQNDRNTYEGPHGSKERFADYEVPGDLVDTEGDWRENYPDYLGCIRSLDDNLGRIVDALEKNGMRENTLIIFTSDHGSHFRTRNKEYKRSCHDGCTHIPMVLNGPGFDQGKRIEDMVSLIDLPRTILRAAETPQPIAIQGLDLQDVIAGKSDRDTVFIQISEDHVGRAIRTSRWKYSVRAPGLPGNGPNMSDVYVEDFLYDLEADPHERKNLVADPEYCDIRRNLQERLKACMTQAGETAPEIRPAE